MTQGRGCEVLVFWMCTNYPVLESAKQVLQTGSFVCMEGQSRVAQGRIGGPTEESKDGRPEGGKIGRQANNGRMMDLITASTYTRLSAKSRPLPRGQDRKGLCRFNVMFTFPKNELLALAPPSHLPVFHFGITLILSTSIMYTGIRTCEAKMQTSLLCTSTTGKQRARRYFAHGVGRPRPLTAHACDDGNGEPTLRFDHARRAWTSHIKRQRQAARTRL